MPGSRLRSEIPSAREKPYRFPPAFLQVVPWQPSSLSKADIASLPEGQARSCRRRERLRPRRFLLYPWLYGRIISHFSARLRAPPFRDLMAWHLYAGSSTVRFWLSRLSSLEVRA